MQAEILERICPGFIAVLANSDLLGRMPLTPRSTE
jgi:hypothetical protein